MKKLLIVRSASFQQLDSNFASILKSFPDFEIHLLTHAHGVPLAEKYRHISRVIVYPHVGQFRKGAPVPGLEGVDYDAVLVPVTNMNGAGFGNVFGFALSLGGGDLYRCNLVGEVTRLDGGALGRSLALGGIYRFAAALPGTILGLGVCCAFLASVIVFRRNRAG